MSKKEKKMNFNIRRFKYGTLSTIITIIFVCAVVLFNIIVGMLVERYPVKLDLTKNKIYEISDKTIDYIKKLEKQVEITVLLPEKQLNSSVYTKQVLETMKKYEQYTDRIKLEFIDMDKNPEKVSKVQELHKGEITENNIVVTCGQRIKVLNVNDIYVRENDGYSTYITGSRTEQILTSAVMNVTDANPKKVGLVKKESASSVEISKEFFKETLDLNGYEVKDVDMLTESIEEYDLVVVIAPLNDFTQTEINKLSDFLYNSGNLGRNMLYISDYAQKETPNIDVFLKEWGVSLPKAYIHPTDPNSTQSVGVYGLSNYVPSPLLNFVDEDSKKLVSDASLPLVAPLSRPIDVLFAFNNDRSTKVILSTPDSTVAIDKNVTKDTDVSTLEKKSFNILVNCEKFFFDNKNDNTRKTSNLTVLGSAYNIDMNILNDTAYNNSEFIINYINKLTGNESNISIVPKNLESVTITMTDQQIAMVKNIIVVIIPCLIIFIGIIVFVRRRNRWAVWWKL